VTDTTTATIHGCHTSYQCTRGLITNWQYETKRTSNPVYLVSLSVFGQSVQPHEATAIFCQDPAHCNISLNVTFSANAFALVHTVWNSISNYCKLAKRVADKLKMNCFM